ncbi:hypothetical protein CBL_02666 [Carabus blaptoides fortunei]
MGQSRDQANIGIQLDTAQMRHRELSRGRCTRSALRRIRRRGRWTDDNTCLQCAALRPSALGGITQPTNTTPHVYWLANNDLSCKLAYYRDDIGCHSASYRLTQVLSGCRFESGQAEPNFKQHHSLVTPVIAIQETTYGLWEPAARLLVQVIGLMDPIIHYA